jgi:hypothetical protein
MDGSWEIVAVDDLEPGDRIVFRLRGDTTVLRVAYVVRVTRVVSGRRTVLHVALTGHLSMQCAPSARVLRRASRR